MIGTDDSRAVRELRARYKGSALAASIVANSAIVKRVRLPVQLLPAASVLSALANFLLTLLVSLRYQRG